MVAKGAAQGPTQGNIRRLRRRAGVFLALTIAASVASIAMLVIRAMAWLIRGDLARRAAARLFLGAAETLSTPLCLMVPVVALASLYLSFAFWTASIEEDKKRTARD